MSTRLDRPGDDVPTNQRVTGLAALALAGLTTFGSPRNAEAAQAPTETAQPEVVLPCDPENLQTLSAAERGRIAQVVCEPPAPKPTKTGEKPVVDALNAEYVDTTTETTTTPQGEPRNFEGPQPTSPSNAKVVIRYGAGLAASARANGNGGEGNSKAIGLLDLELGADYGGVPEYPANLGDETNLKPTNTTPIHGGFGYIRAAMASARFPWLGGYARFGLGGGRAEWNYTPNNDKFHFQGNLGAGLDLHFRRDKFVQPVFTAGVNYVKGPGFDGCGGVEWGIVPGKFGIVTKVCYANLDHGNGGGKQGVVDNAENNSRTIRTNEVRGQVGAVLHFSLEQLLVGNR